MHSEALIDQDRSVRLCEALGEPEHKEGDMQAIKELANRLDGRPAQILEDIGPDNNPIAKIVHEIVHVTETPEQIAAEGEEAMLIEWRAVRDENGGGNGDTARTKR